MKEKEKNKVDKRNSMKELDTKTNTTDKLIDIYTHTHTNFLIIIIMLPLTFRAFWS